jgi:tripartite-type tricarboxylate transporter receptor subunit TctC
MKKLILCMGLALSCVCAWSWPTKEITIVVPFPAGAPTDNLARLIAKDVGETLNTPVIVKNLPGAAGTVGLAHVLNSNNDNHTFVLTINDIVNGPLFLHNIQPYLQFQALTFIGNSPWFFYSAKNTSNLEKFKQEIQEKKTVNVASGSYMSASYLWISSINPGSLFNYILYQGGNYGLDVIGGHVTYGVSSITAVRELSRADKINVIMTSSEKRHPLYPDVPTARELGFNAVPHTIWWGVFARKDTSATAVEIFSDAVRKSVAQNEKIRSNGMTIINSKPVDAEKFFQQEQRNYENLLRKLKK